MFDSCINNPILARGYNGYMDGLVLEDGRLMDSPGGLIDISDTIDSQCRYYLLSIGFLSIGNYIDIQ